MNFPGWRKAEIWLIWAHGTFQKILKIAIDGGASDIHLKIGTPVIFRINRELIAVECPFPTADWMNKVVATITPEHLKKRLEEDREVDFSYFVPGLGRFRTNLFQQRGQWALGDASCQNQRAEL